MSEREIELEKVKEIIKCKIDSGNGGLFHTRNIVGDSMYRIFEGEYFQLDICYFWGYFELFGSTEEEFESLKQFYISLGGAE